MTLDLKKLSVFSENALWNACIGARLDDHQDCYLEYTLTEDKPYTASAEGILLNNGREIPIKVVAFRPGDGTGKEDIKGGLTQMDLLFDIESKYANLNDDNSAIPRNKEKEGVIFELAFPLGHLRDDDKRRTEIKNMYSLGVFDENVVRIQNALSRLEKEMINHTSAFIRPFVTTYTNPIGQRQVDPHCFICPIEQNANNDYTNLIAFASAKTIHEAAHLYGIAVNSRADWMGNFFTAHRETMPII